MLVLDHNPLRPVGKCSGKVSHPVNFSRGQTPKQLGNYSDNCATCCIRDEGRPLCAMKAESKMKEDPSEPLCRWRLHTTMLGSEKAFEVRLRGSSFPPIGDWYFPNIVEPF